MGREKIEKEISFGIDNIQDIEMPGAFDDEIMYEFLKLNVIEDEHQGFLQDRRRLSMSVSQICSKALIILLASVMFSCSMVNRDTLLRNMTKYDKGGEYNCRRYIDSESELARCKKNIREFIWNHWTAKKQGHIQVSYNTSPDSSTTADFFIEAKRTGNWHIAVKRVESSFQNGRVVSSTQNLSIVTVEKSYEAAQAGGEWTLTMKDAEGMIVEDLDSYF